MEPTVLILIGIGIAVYLYSSSEKGSIKEASREVSRLNMSAVQNRIDRLQEIWGSDGVITKQQLVFLKALYFRKSTLLEEESRRAR